MALFFSLVALFWLGSHSECLTVVTAARGARITSILSVSGGPSSQNCSQKLRQFYCSLLLHNYTAAQNNTVDQHIVIATYSNVIKMKVNLIICDITIVCLFSVEIHYMIIKKYIFIYICFDLSLSHVPCVFLLCKEPAAYPRCYPFRDAHSFHCHGFQWKYNLGHQNQR